MKKITLKTCLLFMMVSMFISCEGDYEPYYYSDPSVYSSEDVYLSNLILFMKPYLLIDGEKKYIATEQIHNLTLRINDFWENSFDSYSFDLLRLNPQERTPDFFISDEPIPFAFDIKIAMMPEEMITAGDYANLLSNYWNLQPGAYICHIKSFDIFTIAGERVTVYTPTLTVPLEIKTGVSSVNIGEFEVNINP